jgi:hypothetical protein
VDLADAKTAGERLARTIISRTQIAALADRDRLRSAHCAEVAAERHAQLLGELIARRRGPR